MFDCFSYHVVRPLARVPVRQSLGHDLVQHHFHVVSDIRVPALIQCQTSARVQYCENKKKQRWLKKKHHCLKFLKVARAHSAHDRGPSQTATVPVSVLVFPRWPNVHPCAGVASWFSFGTTPNSTGWSCPRKPCLTCCRCCRSPVWTVFWGDTQAHNNHATRTTIIMLDNNNDDAIEPIRSCLLLFIIIMSGTWGVFFGYKTTGESSASVGRRRHSRPDSARSPHYQLNPLNR